jgi:hypothetical protein
MKTLRVFPDNLRYVKQESLACGSASQPRKPLGSRMMMYARLASHKGMISLREPRKGVILQSAAGEELRPFFGRTLLPSVLRPSGGAFKGEL